MATGARGMPEGGGTLQQNTFIQREPHNCLSMEEVTSP